MDMKHFKSRFGSFKFYCLNSFIKNFTCFDGMVKKHFIHFAESLINACRL